MVDYPKGGDNMNYVVNPSDNFREGYCDCGMQCSGYTR